MFLQVPAGNYKVFIVNVQSCSLLKVILTMKRDWGIGMFRN